MVVRIHNVSKWARLALGEVLELPGAERRKIRIEVNCPAPTRLDLVEGEGRLVFLCVVQGYEVVEFTASGLVHVVPTGDDDMFYFTVDGGEDGASELVDAVSFTKIATRRTRNPELERMMWKMQQNTERRFAEQEAELAALRAATAEREANGREEPDDKAAAGDAGGEDAGAPEGAAAEPAAPGAGSGAA